MDQEKIDNFCQRNNLKFLKKIHSNDFKDSSIFLVEDSNLEKRVVKFHGETSPKDVVDSFKRERNFYEKFSSDFIVSVIKTQENYFILNYVQGYTLRDFLIKKHCFPKELERILNDSKLAIIWFFQNGKGIFPIANNENLVIESLFDRLGNLATSGPRETKRNNFEAFLIRRAWNRSKTNLRQKLSTIIKKWSISNIRILSDFGHYDMHSQNFLINDTEMKIIDFGNFKSPGVWISDILYFYSTIFALSNYNSDYKMKIESHTVELILEIEPNLDKKIIQKIVRLFFTTAEMNSRFGMQSGKIKISKIFEFMRLVSIL